MPSQLHRTLPRPASSPSTYSTSPSSTAAPFGGTPPKNQETEQGELPASSVPYVTRHVSTMLPTFSLNPSCSLSTFQTCFSISNECYSQCFTSRLCQSLHRLVKVAKKTSSLYTHVSLFPLLCFLSPLCPFLSCYVTCNTSCCTFSFCNSQHSILSHCQSGQFCSDYLNIPFL